MGDPEKDLPLDLDSSPWRRWSPILLDVGVVLVGLHIIHALLIAFYPYGVMVGWSRDPGDTQLGPLAAILTGMTGSWIGFAAFGFGLLLLRVGSGLLGWHRLVFCICPLLIPVLWHAWTRADLA
ncbi:hypothetical protein [uncultured Maricaulis sp.]|uniref:hypothetical protein n=1 Tax=uncultured Maricaulis sp. TaxID=174710 RepID=UPI0026334B16|nr:hypothetical protein [uncultured Maricaulis sp.]